MIAIKKKIIFILAIFFIFSQVNATIQDSLFATVGNKAITKSDIVEEIKIILILTGQDFEEERREEIEKSAVQAVIKRKIKAIELERHNFSSFNEDDLESETQNLAASLDLDIDTLKTVFETNKIDFSKIKERLKIELMWNGLIYAIYKDRIFINTDEINDQLEKIKGKKEINEYLISEIIIPPVETNKLNETIDDIKNKIKTEGFKSVAKKLSISETAIKGGDLGWVDENIISNQFRKQVVDTPVGNISEPVFLPEGILFFKIHDKRKIEKITNLKDAENQLVYAEKKKILNMHSLSHFDNLRRSISINYYYE